MRKQFPWLERQGRVGFFGKNCRDLQLFSLSLQSQDQISVPIYDTLGDEAVRYVIEHSEMTVMAVTEEKLPLLAKCLSKTGLIRAIVLLNVPKTSEVLRSFKEAINKDIRVLHFEEVFIFGMTHF